MNRTLIGTGLVVSKGTIESNVKIVKDVADIDSVEDGDIVVLPTSHPMYAMAVLKAAGIICLNGGMLSHICIVSLEMGIPCITQFQGDISKVKDRQKICLDAENGEVILYE